MRVFIAGIDGYLGWPLAVYLSARGHDSRGRRFAAAARVGGGSRRDQRLCRSPGARNAYRRLSKRGRLAPSLIFALAI